MRTNMIMRALCLGVLLAPLAAVESGHADGGKGSGTVAGAATNVNDVRIIAKLTPANSPELGFEGQVARRTQGTSRDEFEARAEVPLARLGDVDPADIHPDLVLAGAIHCAMVFDSIEPVAGVAEYKVSVRSRNGIVSNRAGSCGVTGTPASIPNVKVGDSASVAIGGDTLQGTFAAKR